MIEAGWNQDAGKPMSRVLLCATDAGGVRNLTPLLPEIARRGWEMTFVTRSSLLHLFPPRTPAHRLLLLEDVEGNIEPTLASNVPSAVICGTTRHESPDRDFLRCARQAGVRSVAVVDEWYNYLYRFSTSGQHDPSCLPSVIALPDEQAVREAVAEGLPVGLCQATGSPSLAATWERGKQWQVTPPQVPAVLAGARNCPVITFLSETHALDYGRGPGESGLMGAYIGYTETTVRDLILETLSRLPNDVVFVEKPHPSAQEVELPAHIPGNIDYRLARDATTWELCAHSDAVVGMRSIALLEARLLGCNVASFQPGLIGTERCTAVRLGLVPGLRACDELRNWLLVAMKEPGAQVPAKRPFFARADAADRIVQLALN